jgi:hypothetical protein
MQSRATILSIKREPLSGFDIDGRSFILNVDGVDKSISFSYGGFLPLSVVISQINSDVGSTVAANDNGFLRLQSPTSGGISYLRVKTDPASTPTNALINLGLFPETEAFSGDLTQAQHVDPDRQVASHGQMTMSEGENFEARVFNRAIAQLSLNNDRNEGQISKKRLAVRSTYSVGSYAAGAAQGVQLTGDHLVYVGKTTTPATTELEKLFAILDTQGRELTKETFSPSSTGRTGIFSTTTDGNFRQKVLISGGLNDWSTPYEKGNYYIVSNSFTGGAAVLNGKALKMLEDIGSNNVVIENIDPATGLKVTITDSGISITIHTRDHLKVRVEGVFENVTTAAAGTPRLENNQVAKRSSLAPSRIEMGNRVVVVGQDFTAGPAIRIGDLVTWTGATTSPPFDNNGSYRVEKIIDRETLQLVAADWGAAILNPIVGGGGGLLTIKTDGAFVLDPFLKFASVPATNGLPATGEAFDIAFLKGTTLREATDDNPAILQNDVRFTQEADDTVTRAVLRMWGPSVSSLDGILYSDNRLHVESLNTRLNQEHYTYDDVEKSGSSATDALSWGRHKDIRPDTIDMWYWTPSVTVPRVILRGTGTRGHSTSDLTGDSLLQVRNSSDQVVLQVDSDGRIYNRALASDGDVRTFMDLQFNESLTGPFRLGGTSVSGDRTIWKGKHRWYTSTSAGSNVGLLGQHLLFDFEITGTTGVPRFDRIIGSRIQIDGTTSNAVWTTDLKFLELTGSLNKTATNHGDNQDAVINFYGIHLNYALSADFKIYNDHYGLKIGNITRAGTATGSPGGTNYAIHTGTGIVRFGDAGEIAGNWLPITDVTPDLGSSIKRWRSEWVGGALGTYNTITAYLSPSLAGTNKIFRAIMPAGNIDGDPTGGSAIDISFAGVGNNSALMITGVGANGRTAATGFITHGVALNGSSIGTLTAGNGGWDIGPSVNTWSGAGGNGLTIAGGVGGRTPDDTFVSNPASAGAGGWALTLNGGIGGDQYHLYEDTEESGIGGTGLITTGGRGGEQQTGGSGLNGRGGDGIVSTGGRSGGAITGGGFDTRGGYGILATGGVGYALGPGGDGGRFVGGYGASNLLISGNGITTTGGGVGGPAGVISGHGIVSTGGSVNFGTPGDGGRFTGGAAPTVAAPVSQGIVAIGGAGFRSSSAGAIGASLNSGVNATGGQSSHSSTNATDGGFGVRGKGGLGGGGAGAFVSYGGTGLQGIGGDAGPLINDHTGYGVYASAGIIGALGRRRAPLRLEPMSAPTIGLTGDIYASSTDNKLYICTVSGSPGTWVVVGTQV